MRLSLDALLVLDAIARYGSFAAAAEQLHRVPSAVTYAVQKLEDELGVLLFDRSGHRAQLTSAGQELLREGRQLLAAAAELEERVRRVATGHEVELRIAVDGVIPIPRLFPLVERFYQACPGTRLRLTAEIFGGTWDALVNKRAELVIGAAGEGPGGGDYELRPLGMMQRRFMVAPIHPLADLPEPLSAQDILPYRSVAAADSSRNLPPRSTGLLDGQDVLTVAHLEAKIAAQRAGLGVGYLPVHLTRAEVASGSLRVKEVSGQALDVPLFIAWARDHEGKALEWFLRELDNAEVRAALLA
jgi:DNA-binding transcriptional LysR family regulator